MCSNVHIELQHFDVFFSNLKLIFQKFFKTSRFNILANILEQHCNGRIIQSWFSQRSIEKSSKSYSLQFEYSISNHFDFSKGGAQICKPSVLEISHNVEHLFNQCAIDLPSSFKISNSAVICRIWVQSPFCCLYNPLPWSHNINFWFL